MSTRSGKALRFYDLGDKATLTIPASLLYLNGSTNEIDLEAMVYVNEYKAYNRGTARLLSLQKTWNASLEWMEDTYSGAHVRGGTQFDFSGAGFSAALPVKEWRHLSIRINAANYSLYIDGKLVSKVPSNELSGWEGGTVSLELGNFDGWIDEVVVRSKGPVHTALVPPSRPPWLIGSSQINGLKLTWAAASGATSYLVKRAFSSFGPFVTIGSNLVSTTFTDPKVTNGVTYYYIVSSVNAAGQSSTGTLAARFISVPSAPTLLQLKTASSTALSISWQDNSINETGFYVERSTDGKIYTRIATVAANGTLFSDGSLNPGTKYYYRVRAINSTGASGFSNILAATTL